MADWSRLALDEARRRRLDAEHVAISRSRLRHLAMPLQAVDGVRPAGHRIDARDIGAFAAAGVATLPVVRRPVVAVFADPAGRVPPGQAPGPGERWDGERPLLMARLQEQGIDPLGWPLAMPGPEGVVPALADAAEGVDVVIACGLDLSGARAAWIAAFEAARVRWWWSPAAAPAWGLQFERAASKAAVLALSAGLDATDEAFHAVVSPFLRGLQGDPSA